MSDNPQAATALEFRLPGHDVLAITGRDASAFAQAQFMNDVAALGDGQWQWNGWLTAKGRVIALFALLKFDAETLWLVLPDADAGELAELLQRYVFRSKVALAARDDLHASGAFAASMQASGARFAADGGVVELDMGGDGGPRRLRIAAVAGIDATDARARWDASDLAHGLPRLRGEQVEAWTPQQLSLERLRAFSVKKGCYPGQEIVARTHFLGKAKRRLALLESPQELNIGDSVLDGGQVIGTVISTSGTTSLAVLSVESDPVPLHVGGLPDVREVPLMDGLAR